MLCKYLVILALLVVSPAVTRAQSADATGPVARWKDRPATATQLTEAFGPAIAATLTLWEPWASAQEYTAHIERGGRVIVYLADKARDVRKQLTLVEDTSDYVEGLFGAAPETKDTPAAPASGVDGDYPTFGETPAPPPSGTPSPAVLVYAADEEVYGTALEHAVTLEASLASWVPYGKKLTGCTLIKPLLSAWAVKAKGRVEWDPENEVVHRLTALLTLRRFGEVPYWLLTGLSWYVEIERCKDVYCFPYRDEFVWATEHTAWPKELEKLFAKERDPYLPGLVEWKRGTFEVDRGREAWGFARFVSGHPGAWPAILEDLNTLRRTEGVRHFEDGTWELIVGFEPNVEQQRAVLARHLGEDFEERALESFRGKAAAQGGSKSRGSKR